ncbi:hypothetical protein FQA39_LY03722 [Lamprigera yunnana]|nr:hypothetical protein FQA39_LY03722 [Lamprigera yunnana]
MSEFKKDNETVITESKDDKNFNYKAGMVLAALTGISAFIGFGATLAAVKKQDTTNFNKGVVGSVEMSEPAVVLAFRALGRGTVYAFTGCGILFYAIWKLSGAETLHDFRYKMGSILPKIPRNDPPQGRTEFTGMNDLLEYLSNAKSSKDK